MEVQVHGDDMERALRDLKRMVLKDGILFQLKMRSIGHKHSEWIKAKARRAERRRIKRNGRRMQ